jgi:hypothetical protein
VAESEDLQWEAVASCCSRSLESRQRHQDKFWTYEGPSPFRAKEGEERPGLTHFYSGPYLTERPILAQPDFEPGHVNPGGSGCVPGRSGPKRTRPYTSSIQCYIERGGGGGVGYVLHVRDWDCDVRRGRVVAAGFSVARGRSSAPCTAVLPPTRRETECSVLDFLLRFVD